MVRLFSVGTMSIAREFLRRPGHTGAIATGSRRLAVVAGVGVERAEHVVELGPGTGVFADRAVVIP